MADNKRYYWLKLKDDFFDDDTISYIEEQENGVYYVNFYLKLCLKSLRTEGKLIRLIGDSLIPYDVNSLAKLTRTPVDTVRVAMALFEKIGLVKIYETGEIYLSQIKEMIGTETDKAAIMRRKRAEEKLTGNNTNTDSLQIPAKTNAERQKTFRAKQYCEKMNHIPMIEDHQNKKRYGGNYYRVFKREKGKCAICGSNDNICVHHIDGYNENKPENNAENKMITLCRSCHIRVHRSGLEIPKDILESIDYYDSNESNENDVTRMLPECYTEIEKEIDKEKEIEIDSSDFSTETVTRNRVPYEEIKDYFNSHCLAFPKIREMTDKRKKSLRTFLNKHTVDELYELFDMAQKSDFLTGNNNNNWSANFDWLIKPSNAVKVLEGNYKNDSRPANQPTGRKLLPSERGEFRYSGTVL